MREINFYRTSSDDCPVETFLDALTGQQAQKIVWVMQLIEEISWPPKQYFKKLVNTEGIWEIRAIFGGNIFRVLGFFVTDNLFVATNGFQKKTQKTPKNEVMLAEKYQRDYYRRLE